MTEPGGTPKPTGTGWAVAGVAILSLLQYRVTILIHGPHFDQLVEATRGVTTGNPHWRGYQNRVLGPYLASFADQLTGLGFEIVILLSMMVLPLVQNLLLFWLIRRLTADVPTAFAYTVFFGAAFLGLQDANWLYLWDYLDLMVFSVFLYGTLRGWPTWRFVVVFLVALLNRESALLMAVWLIADALVTEPDPGTLRPGVRDARRAGTGLGLLVVGVVAVEVLRRTLFVASAGERAGIEQVPLGPLGMTRLNHNLGILTDSVFAPSLLMPLAVTVALVVAPIWVLTRLRESDRRVLPIALTFLAAWAGNLVFGLVDESRVHLWLVPFPLFLHLAWSGRVEDGAPTPSRT